MPNLTDLETLYRGYSDDELRESMTAGPESFTDVAWRALREEVTRRQTDDAAQSPIKPLLQPPAMPKRYSAAPYGPRFLAFLIDWFIARGPVVLGVLLFGSELDADAIGRAIGLLLLAYAVWGFYYSFTKDGRSGGQSIGKKHLGLMVVRLSTNEPCSSADSQLRALLLLFLGFVEVAAIASTDGRRLGDRLAGTQVISVDAYVGSRDGTSVLG